MLRSNREGFGAAIAEIVATNPKLMVLSADLSESLQLQTLKQMMPERFVEVGVSEQNMVGVAAGLAMLGKTVVATSFAAFNPGRNWEQIRVSICEQNLDVKIVGSHAGLATGADGATHQALEDLALTTVLPNMKVIAPSDYQEAFLATKAMIAQTGPTYLRLSREKMEDLNQDMQEFKIGEGQILIPDKKVYLISYGMMLPLVLEAAKKLKAKHHLKVGVINMPTIKPLDEQLIMQVAKKSKAIVTVEEHQEIGGLGSLVAMTLAKRCPMPMAMVAVSDSFGQSGSAKELWKHYGLTVDNIVTTVLQMK